MKLKKEKRRLEKKISAIKKIPPFEDPFPKSAVSANADSQRTTGQTIQRKTPERKNEATQISKGPLTIDSFYNSIAGLDRTDKLAVIYEAFADEKITEEEYYQLLEMVDR